jgi:hypothetical protein
LLKFHVEVTSNQARNPTRSLGMDQGISCQSAGVEEAVGGAARIAIDVV